MLLVTFVLNERQVEEISRWLNDCLCWFKQFILKCLFSYYCRMKKAFIHIGIWFVLTYFLFASLSLFIPATLAAIRTFTGIVLIAGMFYLAGWGLTNHFLIKRRKPVLFVLLALIFIIAFAVVRVKVLNLLPGNFPTFNNQFSAETLVWGEGFFRARNLWFINRVGASRAPYFMGLLMNTIILIIATLFRLYEYKAQKEMEGRAKLQSSQEAQILYLKSQVNPHFLFNTLNNLYGLTYSKSDLAPQMVLGLSDTMRYLIYETEQKLVPIEKELNFIQNYLDLEKMRISYPDNIRVSVQIRQMSAFIPPLLLLPFIENCFKHGTIGKEEEGWIEMDIWDEKGSFYFVCKNSYLEKPGKPGIGLDNVKKRLDLIFGETYELKTVNQKDEYMVSLQFPVFAKKDQL